MRPVKAHGPASAGHGHATRRGKVSSRGHESRPRRRPEHDESHHSAPGGALRRLHDTFPFRHPILTLTIALVSFGAVAGILAGGHIAKTQAAVGTTIEGVFASAGFAVKGISLSGNERTTTAAAYTALGVQRGRSIFAFDPAGARDRLLKLPWVADAEVRRQFPDTVVVRLIEKRPFALWRSGAEFVVVERSGAVIAKVAAESFRLPLLTGVGAPEAAAPFIDALGAYKTLSSRVRMIERLGERRWDLLLIGGVTVKLPEDGWETQLADLEQLIGEKSVLDRNIEVIDLRYPDNYVFRLHNGDSRPIPRAQRA